MEPPIQPAVTSRRVNNPTSGIGSHSIASASNRAPPPTALGGALGNDFTGNQEIDRDSKVPWLIRDIGYYPPSLMPPIPTARVRDGGSNISVPSGNGSQDRDKPGPAAKEPDSH